MTVDAHVHVASPDLDRYPRVPATGLGSDWWRGAVAVDDLLGVLDANNVDRAVVVQAVGVYGYDCRYATAAVAAAPERLALVAAVDMTASDPAAAVDELPSLDQVRGVRVFGVGSEVPTWLDDGRADAVWHRAGELGHVVAATLFADRLPALAGVVARHPEVPVAVDHCGFVDVDAPDQMRLLSSLAAMPAVSLKVSSHVLHTAADSGDPARVIDALTDAFGASRLCWGSDHPQHRSLAYPAMVALASHATRHLDERSRADFFSGTATRLWWPAGGSPRMAGPLELADEDSDQQVDGVVG